MSKLTKNAIIPIGIFVFRQLEIGGYMGVNEKGMYHQIVGSDGTTSIMVQEPFIVTEENVQASIALGLDTNRLHQDEDYAKSLGFKGIVVPEAFLGARVSGFVSRNFPDGVIARSKEKTDFIRACYVGDTVILRLWYSERYTDTRGNEHILLNFSAENQKRKTILEGGCVVTILKSLREKLGMG
ncbi:MAG: hypothetical protein A2747_03665 [Candidatus Yonathbacteria bacterium RIFCSPHIGHO2_01_FULL_44_41]|uniref:MaoC-like domain-containing protein n=1 Tax=Candidatus Yonathbacteria bacterium RIFCSPHIGHO2_02_FULL_44_14 TaxID=1802724 RepID=A0A1G2S9V1_9BACT|nr:MAG: hypothetical protein A2747_03665 [Candidatus Yonathbacteria bacterium RIFCSPHIGHO2_01_FULL_44_41]OHA81021.1 MAG: hypothetical protein A3D51_01555 [Candidatus Yonathbacteria bacterium RIFCSPHIGHO2_02_FULL_44_14]OHA81244.1 MAG: hypothetical protein A3B06_03265 [Candidatus Yonathbacteria bacterium RIFCSPLOWO2_01_FULL_43_20]